MKFEKISVDAYRREVGQTVEPSKRSHKYGAQKTTVDGHTFASKLEADRYAVLKLAQSAGVIEGLTLQPRYEVQPAFKRGAQTIRAICYTPDFEYQYQGDLVAEDSKGCDTDASRLRRKLFMAKYPMIKLRIVKNAREDVG